MMGNIKNDYLKNNAEYIFIPNWNNKPHDLPSVLRLNGISILTHQNISAIIAAPGFGKSSVLEAIISTHINPDADCLGFKGNLDYKGIIYCDFERTDTDVWKSFNQIMKRADVKSGSVHKNIFIAGFRAIPKLEDRLNIIEDLLQNNPCSLLLLDGAGDLVLDINNVPLVNQCRIWLREMTIKYNISIFTSLHPNPNSNKPRGHLGSEITREAESVMLIKRHDEETRIITTDFEHGKNRNNCIVNSAFKWHENSQMFLTTDVPKKSSVKGSSSAKKMPAPSQIDEEIHIQILNEVFEADDKLTSKDFLNAFIERWNIYIGNDEMKASRAKIFLSYYVSKSYINANPNQEGNRTFNELSEKYIIKHELVKAVG